MNALANGFSGPQHPVRCKNIVDLAIQRGLWSPRNDGKTLWPPRPDAHQHHL